MLERLQKIIARAGIASRRHAEELISSGMVTVNGRTVTEMGTKADESRDHIKVNGRLLRPEKERIYLLLNKPPEIVSTMSDPEGRRALSDLLHGVTQRVFPVGRLEYHAMGLVFLTNDGDLANLMLKANLPQTYNLKLKTLLTFEEIENLARATGAHIARIKGKDAPWYEVTLSETRSDALRNRLFQTGHPVEKIKRVAIGNLALESLAPGHHRALSDAEVATLLRSVQPKPGVVTPRRMRVKRRPFTPKPKPSRKVKKPFVGAQDEGSLRPEHAHRAVLSPAQASGNETKSRPLSSDHAVSKRQTPARPVRNRMERSRHDKYPRQGPHSRSEKPVRPTHA
ncbi:MAG TPA: S4 domain-containing protein [Candidatus Sulfotelmatobacter sp.]|nr:S4 domain-containing protein [Candidatus Sulfotelmatobacter sp.]